MNTTVSNREPESEQHACPPWCVEDDRYVDPYHGHKPSSRGTEHTGELIRVGDTAMWLRRSDWDDGRNDLPVLVVSGDELGGHSFAELFIEEAEDIAKAVLQPVQAAKEAQG